MKSCAVLFLLLALGAQAFLPMVGAPLGNGFTYQGRLLEAGQPVDGSFDLRFRLFDAVTDGNAIGDPITRANVPVAFGVFTAALDFGAGALDGHARWLEIEVRPLGTLDYTPLGPRQPLTATPYALFAATGNPGPQGPQGPVGPAGVAGPQGIAGPKGDKGDTGPQGLAGVVGPQGAKGDKGDPGTTGATGPQGPAGPQGAAGPKGEKGDTGPQGLGGATGPQGAKGDKGDKGDPGATGPTGAVGATGPQGLMGPPGGAGPKGDKGDTGPQGIAGAVGPQGAKGDKGDTGAVGASGPQGLTGPPGAAGPTGDKGDAGPQGVAGAVGPQGAKGDKGDTGAVGATGPQGPAGPRGLTGLQGPVGATGPVGPAGPIGPAGPRGAQGAQGVPGPQGPQGPPGSADAWSRLGNAGTIAGVNFLGTTDARPLQIRVNNSAAIHVQADGRVGFGGTAVDVGAVAQFNLPSAATTASTPVVRLKSPLNSAGFGLDFVNPTITWDMGPNLGGSRDNRFVILPNGSAKGIIVAPNGNVGIDSGNADSPFATLTVNGTIGFPTVASPMFYIYPSGTVNAEKPVLVHSPAFPGYGLYYRDDGDRFVMKSSPGDTTPSLVVDLDSNWVTIATETPKPGYELSVRGQIVCQDLLIQDPALWADYVFAPDYALRPLEEVEAHIQTQQHLPGMPSAAEVERDGLLVSDMQRRMMEKIEELTLYAIDQNKRLLAQDKQIVELQKTVSDLTILVANLTRANESAR